MTEQFEMKKEQSVSFSESEANQINKALDFIESYNRKKPSVNHFIKTATVERAKEVLKGENNE